ncbi:MAG TPA: hypothetical protein VNX65_03145 [Patescibacteria group bacterium]|jgi:hypothetical protein|nr:hypothetical protein [Patescibacteria group bacterium]
MNSKNTITVNGKLYDSVTGLPVAQALQTKMPAAHNPQQAYPQPIPSPRKGRPSFVDIAPQQTTKAHATHAATANRIHRQPQRSQTLYRAVLKKPVAKPILEPVTHPAISRFGSNHQPVNVTLHPAVSRTDITNKVQSQDIAPTTHPLVKRAMQRGSFMPVPLQTPPSSRDLKEQLIRSRLAEVDTMKDSLDEQSSHRSFFFKPRFASILTSAFAFLLLGGYLTYMNLPNLSTKVAAARAGIAARFPNYHPDGYSFNGPVSYAPGEVTIAFKSNTNDEKFDIKQKASNWDSQAVVDNYVSKQSSTYLTYQERGLTIYSFNNKAAWVSGGMFYIIDGSAQLSSEQVLRIATSI